MGKRYITNKRRRSIMKITQIRVTERAVTGQYEHEEISVEAILAETDELQSCLASLKKEIRRALDKYPTISETEVKEEEKQEEKKTEEKTEEKAEKPKRKTKAKNTPYDRTNELHKKLLSEALESKDPNWKKNPKASEVSKAMNGKDFLSPEGVRLPEFVDEFVEMLKA
jgi:hypothetical protein